MDAPEAWRWIWLATTVVGVLAEIGTPVAFGFLPVGIGGAVATVLAFAGVNVGLEFLAFIVVTVVAYAALLPVGRRLAAPGNANAHGIGALRWVGRQAVVIDDIPGVLGATGTVRLERERWNAESDEPIASGATVVVTHVHGTRLVVQPVAPSDLPTTPDPGASS